MAQAPSTTGWRANSVKQSFYDYFLEQEGLPV